MPELKLYQGRPVKKMYQKRGMIVLIFYSPTPGLTGERLEITQADWDRDSTVQEIDPANRPDVRALARAASR